MGASVFHRFPARLREGIASRLGWSSLRPVQELAGHAILDGKNCVVLAPTAGGKTEASMFPVLAGLVERPPEAVGAIYVAPIKALLNNQTDRLGIYTEMVGLRRFVWHGDATDAGKRAFLAEPTELLMTTPESLEVMLLSSRVPHVRLFQDVQYVVIDEVHAMAGTDRGSHLMSVLERLFRHSRYDVQRVGLSATVGNPTDILTWMQGTSKRSAIVINPPKQPSNKDIKVLLLGGASAIANRASEMAVGRKSLFYCQSRALTEDIARRMGEREVDVFVHHSSVSREERAEAEHRFHHGANACIVCTSTLELGIDVGDLDLVLQANAPSTVSSFLQRMGRTGRREGQRSNTTFFCEDPEIVLQAVAIVELAKRGWVESVPPQTRAWPVLVHQLLAMTLQFGSIGAEDAWSILSRVPDFAAIQRSEFDTLIAHMLATDYLFQANGKLLMGGAAERAYGRKNFMELYAVFSTPQLYTVVTEAGHPIGSLEQDFVDKLEAELSSFLLGGRAWTVVHVNHEERRVRVRLSTDGKKPKWGGFAPQLLSYELCQSMAEQLCAAGRVPYINDAAQAYLDEARSELGPLLLSPGYHFQRDDGRLLWWTFAGGRINHTIKHGLMAQYGWKVIADNVRLRIDDDMATMSHLDSAIAAMKQESFWSDPKVAAAIQAQLPEYRLSKFQPALPKAVVTEMIASYLLDVPCTVRFLQRG